MKKQMNHKQNTLSKFDYAENVALNFIDVVINAKVLSFCMQN